MRGFGSLGAFFDATPGVSYSELAKLLSEKEDVAPVQIERLHREVTGDSDEAVRRAALDSVTRFLRGALKKGWGCGRYWQSNVVGALGSWAAMWGGGPQFQGVKVALFSLNPPTGWIPEPANDPLLVTAFERGWHLAAC